jgi:hypothetical protein
MLGSRAQFVPVAADGEQEKEKDRKRNERRKGKAWVQVEVEGGAPNDKRERAPSVRSFQTRQPDMTTD